ncbi:MAG: radical SAM protein [bacterium]|nr:radical SAM protein [bacterium]
MIFKYLYGPVFSWRLGRSLGIDLISTKAKSCNFDCTYCQIGETKNFISERKIFVKTEDVIEELKNIDDKLGLDVLTFSGRGEPTLAANLGEVIFEIKNIDQLKNKKMALITNSSLLSSSKLQTEIKDLDIVMVKFDACSPEYLKKINNPDPLIQFLDIYEGLKSFRKVFKGELELQIMFVANGEYDLQKTIELVKNIAPDRVHLNAPFRPSKVSPITESEINEIKKCFLSIEKLGIKVESVYDVKKEKIKPINEKSTVLRRGKE